MDLDKPPHLSRLSVVTARVVALMAALVSVYMAYYSFRYAGHSRNWGDVPCLDTIRTRWGYWMKLPVALPGAILYILITVLAFRVKPWDAGMVKDRYWSALVVLVTLVAATGTWLLVVQLALLRYLCPFCLIVNLCGVLLFLVFASCMGSRLWTVALTVLFAGGVVALQFVISPPQPKSTRVVASPPEHVQNASGDPKKAVEPRVQSVANEWDPTHRPPNTDLRSNIFNVSPDVRPAPWETSTTQSMPFVPIVSVEQPEESEALAAVAPVESAPVSLERALAAEKAARNRPEVARTHVTLADGKVYLKLDEAPFLGSPNAPYIVAVMYDYTVPSCLQLLRLLRYEVARYKGALGVALLPVPLDHHCNQNLRFTPEKNEGACKYAQASVKIWLTNRESFVEFEEYITSGPGVLPMHKLQWAYARLFKPDVLDEESLNREVDMQIGRNCSFWKQLEFGALPKLIFRDELAAGSPENREDMAAFMEEALGFAPAEVDEKDLP